MDIQEALQIGDLSKGQIVAGIRGIDRTITSIEVMEVPELSHWVSPGLLVMTAFYSIRDDQERQIEILRTLINNEAAGIVIKLGRFIDLLPEPMLRIAEDCRFPIITIPKEISYISILTPLYERLYEEKKERMEEVDNPFRAFIDGKYQTLDEALDTLQEIVGGSVYIEDEEGLLLYVAKGFKPDGWRRSPRLFSVPEYKGWREKLREWNIKEGVSDYEIHQIPGFRPKIIVRLYANQHLIAFLNLSITDKGFLDLIRPEFVGRLSTLMSELFLNEQLLLQRNRMEDIRRLDEFWDTDSKTEGYTYLVRFDAEWISRVNFPSFHLIDHISLISKYLNDDLLGSLQGCRSIVFSKYDSFYAIVNIPEGNSLNLIFDMGEVIKSSFADVDLKVAVSSRLLKGDTLEASIRSVDQTLTIGKKIHRDDRVYTFDKLGIYEILLNLSSVPLVQEYIGRLLNPLIMDDVELLETLEVYLDENGNVTKASERLHIHRRTLTNRLYKIQEILHLDLDESENRFALMFCLNVIRLSK